MAFNPPIVDDFTGSNGSIDNRVSSSGAVWAAPSLAVDSALQINTNTVRSITVGTRYSAIIDSKQYGPDIESAMTITQVDAGSDYLTAYSNGYGPFPETFGDGNLYSLEILPGNGGAPGAYILHQTIGLSDTELINQASSSDFNSPESIGLSLVEEPTGTRCTVWRKIAGVWTAEVNVLDTNSSRPSGLRYLGMSLKSTSTVVIADDFMAQTTGGVPVAWYGAAG